MAVVEYSVDQRVGLLRLNRPERRNSFTDEMLDAWVAALEESRDRGDVRAIVVTGSGEAFCSGVDLEEFSGREDTPLARKRYLMQGVHRVAHLLEGIDKPVIAAVNAAAVGAGLDMALMCDLRFAAAGARFSTGYVRVALVPGDGGAYFLPRLVGPAKALELLLTGDLIDAAEALRIGMVNRIYPDAELLDETLGFARRLASGPQTALAMIKRAVKQSERLDLRTALDLISSHFGIAATLDDAREGIAAFREHRRPEYGLE